MREFPIAAFSYGRITQVTSRFQNGGKVELERLQEKAIAKGCACFSAFALVFRLVTGWRRSPFPLFFFFAFFRSGMVVSSFCRLKLIPCFRTTRVRFEVFVSALGTGLLLAIMIVGGVGQLSILRFSTFGRRRRRRRKENRKKGTDQDSRFDLVCKVPLILQK